MGMLSMSSHVRICLRIFVMTKWLSIVMLASFLCMWRTCSAQIAVNPVTNKIYAGNQTLSYVDVIDGATHELTKVFMKR